MSKISETKPWCIIFDRQIFESSGKMFLEDLWHLLTPSVYPSATHEFLFRKTLQLGWKNVAKNTFCGGNSLNIVFYRRGSVLKYTHVRTRGG